MLQHKLSKIFYNLYRYFSPKNNVDDSGEPIQMVEKNRVYLGDASLTMKFYKATGGTVVQVITIDQVRNQTSYNTISSSPQETCTLHIIENGRNIGEELEKIITLTQLSR